MRRRLSCRTGGKGRRTDGRRRPCSLIPAVHWEYKGLHANLDAAYQQLLQYREALQNPPLLVVCDTDRIIVHANFINTVKQ